MALLLFGEIGRCSWTASIVVTTASSGALLDDSGAGRYEVRFKAFECIYRRDYGLGYTSHRPRRLPLQAQGAVKLLTERSPGLLDMDTENNLFLCCTPLLARSFWLLLKGIWGVSRPKSDFH